MLLFCPFHIHVTSVVLELTANKYINLHLNQAISCIQHWIWDYICIENTGEVQDTEKITDPCLLQTHSGLHLTLHVKRTPLQNLLFNLAAQRSP